MGKEGSASIHPGIYFMLVYHNGILPLTPATTKLSKQNSTANSLGSQTY